MHCDRALDSGYLFRRTKELTKLAFQSHSPACVIQYWLGPTTQTIQAVTTSIQPVIPHPPLIMGLRLLSQRTPGALPSESKQWGVQTNATMSGTPIILPLTAKLLRGVVSDGGNYNNPCGLDTNTGKLYATKTAVAFIVLCA